VNNKEDCFGGKCFEANLAMTAPLFVTASATSRVVKTKQSSFFHTVTASATSRVVKTKQSSFLCNEIWVLLWGKGKESFFWDKEDYFV
jgi:hypothetical protein